MGMTNEEREERKALMQGVQAEQRAAKEAALKALRLASMALEDLARAMLLTEFREWRNHGEAQRAMSLSGEIDTMVEGLSH